MICEEPGKAYKVSCGHKIVLCRECIERAPNFRQDVCEACEGRKFVDDKGGVEKYVWDEREENI